MRKSSLGVDVYGGRCEKLKSNSRYGLLKITLLAIYTCAISSLFAQNSSVQILEPDGSTPIHLAHVWFKCQTGENQNKGQWTITDNKGWATNPFADTSLVKISHVGYAASEFVLFPGEQKRIVLSESSVGLNETVVTAEFSAVKKKESTYKINSISKQQLVDKGANNLREAITGELHFRTNNGHANETSVNLNGLSGNHVKIMVDGVPVVGRLRGNIDLSQLNLNNIERIEVIEGPTSVVYGTNALGGVVNLITKKNSYHKKNIVVNSYVESIGQYNLDAGFSFSKKKNLYTFNAGRNFFAGFSEDKNARLKEWKPREQYFGNFMISRRVKHFKFIYSLDGFTEKMTSRGAPQAPYFVNAFDTYYKTDRLSNKVLLRGRVSGNKHLDITASHSHFSRTRNIYFKQLTTLTETLTPNENDQDTTQFGNILFRAVLSSRNNKDSSKTDYLVGAEINRDRIVAGRISAGDQHIGNYAMFIQGKYRPNRSLTIQPAIRYAYNTRYNAPLVPSLNVLYRLNEQTDIRMSYAKGFRAPDLKELFLEFHFNSSINLWGNTDLKPENSDHFNLFLDFTEQMGDHRLEISPKWYYTRVNNLISLMQTTDVDWVYTNINYFVTTGGALSCKYRYKNYSFNSAINLFGNYNSVFDDHPKGNAMFYSKDVTSGFNYEMDSLGLNIGARYKYTGSIRSFYISDEQNIQESFIGDFHTLDITATKSFRDGGINLTAGVKNLFDVSSVRMVGEIFGVSNSNNASSLNVLFGRTAFVSLRINL